MKFILGTKQQMTQVFTEEGRAHAATVVKAPKAVVTQIKNDEKDGYVAVQVASDAQKKERVKKPQQKKLAYKNVKEFRIDGTDLKEGDTIEVSAFEPGDKVTVVGISKGKGFQGVVKRHGFHGGPRSHGQKHSEREPGSIGATGPQRVFKGTRMGGRMGSDRVTVKGLKILQVDAENELLLVSGAVPGRRGTLLEIRCEDKKTKS